MTFAPIPSSTLLRAQMEGTGIRQRCGAFRNGLLPYCRTRRQVARCLGSGRIASEPEQDGRGSVVACGNPPSGRHASEHDRLPIRSVRNQSHHDPGKHGHVAPPLPAVLERLGRPYFLAAPLQRKPLRLFNIMRLGARLLSTRGLPFLFGKYGRGRAI